VVFARLEILLAFLAGKKARAERGQPKLPDVVAVKLLLILP